jgi:hypothetical protein
MNNSGNDGDGRITVGNIDNSTGIAIGHGARASVNQPRSDAQDEISEMLADFIRSLGRYLDYVEDAKDIQETAIDARTEVMRPSPKWQVVRRMLTTIAASVAGVAALTDAINNIQALVERIAG